MTGNGDECKAVGGMRISRGNQSTWRKADLGSNWGLHNVKPATNCLSYGIDWN
jgi:hypothetical protein